MLARPSVLLRVCGPAMKRGRLNPKWFTGSVRPQKGGGMEVLSVLVRAPNRMRAFASVFIG